MRRLIRFDIINFMPTVFMMMMGAVSGCTSRVDKIANIDSKGNNIICFGDSLTRGEGAGADESYPHLLSQGFGMSVINAGVSGDTTYSALERLDRDVLAYNPLLVVVEFGGNDMLKRIPSEETFENLSVIIKRIQEKGAMVAVLGIEPAFPFSGSEYRNGFKKLVAQYSTVLIPNILGGIIDDPRYKSDSVHPNKEGYEIVYRRVYELIEPLVKRNMRFRELSVQTN